MIYWAIKVENTNKKFFREESGLGILYQMLQAYLKQKMK